MSQHQISSFYLNKTESVKGCLLALRDIIIQKDPNVSETVKWGMPCFCYKKKMFCFLWTDHRTGSPYLLMVEGKYLDHPELEAGSRSRMKIFRVNEEQDLPIDTIEQLLNDALNLYRSGTIGIK
jgi:uncharacterized protein YdhG (YjbR/CyaY superfamily)